MPRLSHRALVPSVFCHVSKRNEEPKRPCGSAVTVTVPGAVSTPSNAPDPRLVSAAHSTVPGAAGGVETEGFGAAERDGDGDADADGDADSDDADGTGSDGDTPSTVDGAVSGGAEWAAGVPDCLRATNQPAASTITPSPVTTVQCAGPQPGRLRDRRRF